MFKTLESRFYAYYVPHNQDCIGHHRNACTRLNQMLQNQRYLLGERMTLANVRGTAYRAD